MRVLVLGAGAIGGYFGARLVESGADVSFLVRPPRAALLAEHGLRVFSEHGDFAAPVHAITAADDGKSYDLVVLSCKAFDLDSAIAAIRPAVGPDTLVLPLLNGVRHLETLDAVFGAERVLGGLAHISVTLEADGGVRQFGAMDRLTWGGRNPAHPPSQTVVDGLGSTRAEIIQTPAILDAMWDKFVLIAALAGITCLMRGSVGEIAATTAGAGVARALHGECVRIATAVGHPPSARSQAETSHFLTQPGLPLKASMLRDIERGAATEGAHVLGDLFARGQAAGVDTPLLAAAWAHVQVYEGQRADRAR